MIPPRFNVAPTQDVPIIRQVEGGARQAVFARWGLAGPDTASGRSRAAKTINARAETVFERSPFHAAVRSRRCLVPATGFVEWEKQGRARLPFHIHRAGTTVFAMAGIWSQWSTHEGSVRLTCSILTTRPNEKVAALHARMPVILPKDAYALWLDPKVAEPEPLAPLLAPLGSAQVVVEPISTRVNRVAHDDAACLEPRDPSERSAPRQLGFGFDEA